MAGVVMGKAVQPCWSVLALDGKAVRRVVRRGDLGAEDGNPHRSRP